jgi:uncharacterized membrane protein (UPF0136 family)
MQNFANTVLWIYILLLLIGGLIGFFKGKSKVSLITSAVCAAVLAVAAIPNVLDAGFAQKLTMGVTAALLVVFAIRLAETRKFMPSGLMLVITGVALALRSLHFN